jgi:hypothetical protein
MAHGPVKKQISQDSLRLNAQTTETDQEHGGSDLDLTFRPKDGDNI